MRSIVQLQIIFIPLNSNIYIHMFHTHIVLGRLYRGMEAVLLEEYNEFDIQSFQLAAIAHK